MRLRLKVWRQKGRKTSGEFITYSMDNVNPDMSMLECLDVLNEELIGKGEDPIAFEHDCREGICGSCGFMINGIAHGPLPATTVCQLTMRHFKDGEELVVEPWRARAFPPIKDLVVDRRSFDRIIAAGGYISVSTGSAPDGNAIPVPKEDSDRAMDAAACIGCGACVAACPNASAALFTGAKMTHLGILPQGKPERDVRAIRMVAQMNAEGFGGCTNIGECTGVCPKEIALETIAAMNRDYFRASWRERDNVVTTIRPFTEWSTGSKLQNDPQAGK
ncbi:MAG: succinate dehydrogenase/fumarate reductase iron-sulfur subunit [Bryobacteraceae bacterium]